MPQTFIVDQTQTFQAVAFLSSEPRTVFGERDRQDQAKDGTPKWDVQLIAGFRDNFGKVQNEVLKVGVTSHKDPGEGLSQFMPVQLIGLTVGVMERTARDDKTKVIGVTVWYRVDEIRPLAAVPTSRPKASE